MRTTLLGMVAALLLISAGAAAQENSTTTPAVNQADVAKTAAAAGDLPLVNQVDFGIRGTFYGSGSDEARYQRYRDFRDGGTIDLFRMLRETDKYQVKLQGDHIGYRDERFYAGYTNFGKLKASFEWNQIPLYYSNTTATLYDTSTSGQVLMSDAYQSGIQNKTLTLPAAMTNVVPFELRTRRDVAFADMTYSATPTVDLGFIVRNTNKVGEYPWGGSFGISNAIATEMPVPVDHRTTDLGTNLEYANRRVYGKLAYDGSFFRNNTSTLVWDNPARVTDSPTAGPKQGRMDLWPNTDMNTVSAMGAYNFTGHSRASAYLSFSNMTNNDAMMPFTINSAIQSPALTRPTAEVNAHVTTMNYALTSRPLNTVWFNVRYRQYQVDNRTEPFLVNGSVNYDTSPVATIKESEPFGQNRHTFDADATYSPIRILGFRAGYTREEVNRTYRIIEDTTEDIGRVSMDVTGVSWLTVRGVFEHSKRRGSAANEAELIAIGEQPTLRHYDISDRDQDRFSTIITVSPASTFSFNGSVAWGKQDYPGTNFGVQSADSNVYSIGFDFIPRDGVSLGAMYGWERYTAFQKSRTANPLPAGGSLDDPTQQFNDPRRDWTDDSKDKVNTFDVSMDLLKVLPRTNVKFAYDYSKAHSTYFYGLAPNTTLPQPVQLTPVVNELQRGTLDVTYFVTRHLGVGGLYWYDYYRVDDFALNPVESLSQPANSASPTLMMLGYFYKPYTANTILARLTYLW